MRLTNEQRIKAVQLYYQNNNNGAKTARLLSDEYNIPRVQSRNIKNLIRKFVHRKCKGCSKSRKASCCNELRKV